MSGFIHALGRRVLDFLAFFGGNFILFWQVLGSPFRRAMNGRHVIQQMAQVGIASLPIAAVTTVFSGMVLAYHSAQQAEKLGVANLVGWLVAESMCRELGPVLTAIVVAARAGSGMTAEIGTMKVTEQLLALRALATDPVDYLVAPRFMAAIVMLPLLTVFADVIGVAGGYFVAAGTGIVSSAAYWSNIVGRLEAWTVIGGIIKTIFFGAIIALVSCHQGLTCQMASEDVGRAVTRAVVYCIMLVYAANLFLTAIIYPG